MKIVIEIETSNAAFHGGDNALAWEVNNILNRLIDRVDNRTGLEPHRILDSNGNRCGTVVVEK